MALAIYSQALGDTVWQASIFASSKIAFTFYRLKFRNSLSLKGFLFCDISCS